MTSNYIFMLKKKKKKPQRRNTGTCNIGNYYVKPSQKRNLIQFTEVQFISEVFWCSTQKMRVRLKTIHHKKARVKRQGVDFTIGDLVLTKWFQDLQYLQSPGFL